MKRAVQVRISLISVTLEFLKTVATAVAEIREGELQQRLSA